MARLFTDGAEAGRGAPRRVNLREVMNALRYLTRTGCQWRMLPHDFPPWETVYYCLQLWRDDGAFERLNRELGVCLSSKTRFLAQMFGIY